MFIPLKSAVTNTGTTPSSVRTAINRPASGDHASDSATVPTIL